jgi:predicted transcriptional regulator of viral defense system
MKLRVSDNQILSILSSVPAFRVGTVSNMTQSVEYGRLKIERLYKAGKIKRITRGVYTIHRDPMIYATSVFYPSYISLWSALQYNGMTTQLPKKIEVMSYLTFASGNSPFAR